MRSLGLGLLLVLSVRGGDWSPQRAADYLDQRQKEWIAWKGANGSGTPCMSCHTGLPYLLARPVLRSAIGGGQTPQETAMVEAVKTRLANPPKGSKPSRGVDSVLSALLLSGDPELRDKAFDYMWSLQKPDGTWDWFNLNLDPWEMPESPFFGASVAALAVGSMPAEYRARPGVQEHVELLRSYLSREQAAQTLHNRLILVWASTRWPEVLTAAERKAIVASVLKGQGADGGWSLQSLGEFKPHAEAVVSEGSNSYATALVSYILQQTGLKPDQANVRRGLAWLRAHQDPEKGYWDAASMNHKYEPGSMPEQFMRDAATAYASLALLAGR